MTSFFNFMRNIGFHRGPERIVGGIAGGIARQLNAPVAAVRLIMLIMFLLPGFGLAAYLIVWIITPNSTGGIPLERFLDGYHNRA